jgi:hypothetical protein
MFPDLEYNHKNVNLSVSVSAKTVDVSGGVLTEPIQIPIIQKWV